MTQQKIVIRVVMPSDKHRSKAMALVAATGGVVSVELAGDDRDKVVVVAEHDVDSIRMTTALRRKVGPAKLVQVGDAKKKDEEKKIEYYHPGWYYYDQQYHHSPPVGSAVYEQCHHPAAGYGYGYGNTCSIM